MKANYFLRRMSALLIALISVYCLSAQVKEPAFTELTDIVIADGVGEPFTFTYETAVAWGDYNNDGYLDLFTNGNGSNGRATVLYKNNAGVNFTKVEHPFPGLGAAAAIWLDYDNDGNLDLFIAGRGAEDAKFTGLYHNLGPDGDYEFEEVFPGVFPYIDHEGGNRPNRYLAVADYNNDGWTDILMTGTDGSKRQVSLYKNVQGIYFQLVESPVNGEKSLIQMNGGTIAWYDYNKDGFMDIAINGYYDDNAYPEFSGGGMGIIYQNNGDGTFAEPYLFPAGTTTLIPIDYNNDGWEDLVAIGYCWSREGYWTGVDWHADIEVNKGDGTFERIPKTETGLNGNQEGDADVGDVNNDGYEDVLELIREHESDAVYLNNLAYKTEEEPIFKRLAFSYNLSQRGGMSTLVDYDRDNDLDALLIAYADISDHFARFMRNDLGEGIPVNQAPAAPTNLRVSTDDEGVTTFSWDAATDDITPVAALRYNLYVEQDGIIKSVIPAELTTGRLKVNELLAPLATTSYTLNNLEGEYTWGVQTIDQSRVASPFAVYGETALNTVKPVSVTVVGDKQNIRLKADAALTGTVNIYSTTGANVFVKAGQINNTNVELPAGLYVVKASSAEGSVVKKVIVR